MSSEIGKHVRISLFGESHGSAVGVVIYGLPAGEDLDMEEIQCQMNRRAPGRDKSATPRREADTPEILSGFHQKKTTGTPLCAIIQNTDARSGDYAAFSRTPRPGHADYTGAVRYGGHGDTRGGGHFSGRLTASMVFAGAVCRQILSRRGVTIGGHVHSIGSVSDTPFDPVRLSAAELTTLSQRSFPVVCAQAEAAMREEIETARRAQDSVGGIVEAAAIGLPAGLGTPMFDGVENVLTAVIFGIPAVKGVEFGAGFAAAGQRGSVHNDPFCYDARGCVATATNNHGGILGGITSGMPLVLRAAIKPTPSIGMVQRTVDLKKGTAAKLTIEGRHDPCIVPRAVPVVESAMAVGLLDLMREREGL